MAEKTIQTKDLLKSIRDKREAYRAFRFGSAGTKARDVKEGRNLKKDIARLMTEANKEVSEK